MGIGFELENMHTDPNQTDGLLMEMIHTVCLKSNMLPLIVCIVKHFITIKLINFRNPLICCYILTADIYI